MPANHPPDARRGKVPQAMFWGGMALAPVAVLILLFGQSTGALRAAVVLAVLTIVLLAVSMAMRPSVDLVRVDIEHRVLDEMERIRVRTRDETAMVARHTAKALADRIHAMNETIEDLRSQVDEAQAVGFIDPHRPQAIGPGQGGHPGVRRTETVHVTRRTTYDDTGSIYGSRSAQEHGRPAVEGEWREDRYERRDGDGYDDRPWSVGRPEPRALPPARGEPAAQYVDERYRDERYRDERYRDERYRDERYRDERYPDERHPDERYRDRYDDRDRERHRHERDRYERDRYERDRYERDPGYDRYDDRARGGYDRHDDRDRYERERGYDRGGHDRGHDDRDRGYDRERYDRPHVPRPRSPEW